MLHTCGAIQFGDENGKVVTVMGSGRKALFRHMKEYGTLPEGFTLLAQQGGGAVLPIGYDEINWETVGDLGQPRHLGGLQNGYKGVPKGFERTNK